jgi:redox-sensitive bicupin YhaK (pirin superfamily)
VADSPDFPQRRIARIVDPSFEPGHTDGHRARRLIDSDDPAASDPFLLMAEDIVPRGAFGPHPHRGLETVTLVLEGALEHYDSAGNGGIIEAGDAQWMTAGRGVVHNESPLEGTIAHAVQLWVNLPAATKMTEPRYQALVGGDLPIRREPGVEVRVLSGRSGDVVSPTLNHVPITALDARLTEGASFAQTLDPDTNGFVLMLEGEALIGSDPVKAGQLAWLSRADGQGSSAVTVVAGHAARLLLFVGQPLREPVVFGGPFVMNTEAEIVEAFADYRSGRF